MNLKKILFNKNYEATKEDLSYFNKTFENMILDKSLMGIFSFKKIKNFIKELS